MSRPHIRANTKLVLRELKAELSRASRHARQFHVDMLESIRETRPRRHIFEIPGIRIAREVFRIVLETVRRKFLLEGFGQYGSRSPVGREIGYTQKEAVIPQSRQRRVVFGVITHV